MSGDLEHTPPPPTAGGLKVRETLEKNRDQIARALPAVLTPDRFLRLVYTELRTIPKLQECTTDSLLGGVMRMASLGLEPGGPLGQCWLLPFDNHKSGLTEATFILGYKGIVNLCHRGGQVTSIYAREVCERDQFDYEYGLHDKLEHRPASKGQRGPATHFYGVARFQSGGYYFLVHNRDETEEHRQRSKSPDRGPWVSDYNAMGKKTVIRAMAPFLPLTAEATVAIDQDGQVIRQSDNDYLAQALDV